MKVRLLGLAVVLVAIAAIVNALALSEATIKNGFSISVENTTNAMIALAPAAGNDKDVDVETAANGYLELSFADGFQRNSTYKFSPAFKITNNSKETVDMAVTFTSTAAEKITVTAAAVAGGDVQSFTDVPPGKSVFVELTVDMGIDAVQPAGALTMTVTATK
jgi:hypothetical protein